MGGEKWRLIITSSDREDVEGSGWGVNRGIGLEGLRKTTKYPSQRSGEPDRDSKPERPEYKAGIFLSAVQFVNWYPSCKSVIVSVLDLQCKHGCDVFKLVCVCVF